MPRSLKPSTCGNTPQAGTYVCNATFYALQHLLATRPEVRSGFVHVPRSAVGPEQAASALLAILLAASSAELDPRISAGDPLLASGAEHLVEEREQRHALLPVQSAEEHRPDVGRPGPTGLDLVPARRGQVVLDAAAHARAPFDPQPAASKRAARVLNAWSLWNEAAARS